MLLSEEGLPKFGCSRCDSMMGLGISFEPAVPHTRHVNADPESQSAGGGLLTLSHVVVAPKKSPFLHILCAGTVL